MNWLYKKWWKWLCVVLLIYVIAGSFFVKLGPGITKVSPVSLHTDSVYTFQISAYHAHLTDAKAGKVQLWFKNKNKYYAPLSFKVLSDDRAEAQFAVASAEQDTFVPASIDVVMNDDLDGTFALRDAITLVKSTTVDTANSSRLTVTEPEVAHNKHQLFCYPYREILYETIRNTFFHVPMWFAMTLLVFASAIYSIRYLMQGDNRHDIVAEQAVVVAMLFGVCGYLTGLVWSKYTWYIGVSWGDVIRKLLLEDIKMAAALIAMFFYFAYLVIRSSIEDKAKRGKISAVVNIFCFVIFILCVFVLPRLTDSMHPGNGGNPAFSKYDLDSTLRLFFYPAVIGWILLGFWILSVLIRLQFIQQKKEA
jgi:heme exporter protein C